jgi:hypothetical protein
MYNYREISGIIKFAIGHVYTAGFNFVRIHSPVIVKQHNLEYNDVVPFYRDVCRIFYESFRKNPKNSMSIFYNNIPPCAFYAIEDDVFTYVKPTEGYLSPEIHSAELAYFIKPPLCTHCRFNKTCHGIFRTYVSERGLSEFKAVISSS